MKLLFKRPEGFSPSEWAIALITRGPYCHVEIILDDNSMMFSSNSSDDGVRFMDRGEPNPKHYEVVDLPPVDPALREAAIQWAMKQRGKAYDWPGVFGFVVPWVKEDDKDWFCSEIVCELLVRLKLLPSNTSRKIDPNKLAKVITKAIAPPRKLIPVQRMAA